MCCVPHAKLWSISWQIKFLFLNTENICLHFVHIYVCNLITTNIRIFIDFKTPIMNENFYPMAQPLWWNLRILGRGRTLLLVLYTLPNHYAKMDTNYGKNAKINEFFVCTNGYIFIYLFIYLQLLLWCPEISLEKYPVRQLTICCLIQWLNKFFEMFSMLYEVNCRTQYFI